MNKYITHDYFNRRQFITSSLAIAGSILIPIKAQCTEIQELNGKVFVNRKRADKSTLIHPGDSIVTSHNGRLIFALGDDSFMVRPRTALQLDTDDNLLLTGL